jgi:RNA polymerase sigma factor (sigma-70 family)
MSLPDRHPRASDDGVRKLPEESALIESARTDATAFEALYRQHRQRIADHIQRRVVDPSQVEEIVAEVFVSAWRGLPRYEARGTPFRAWLYRIAGNAVRKYFRTKRPLHESLDERAAAEPNTDAAVLRAAIAQLPRELEEVVVLHHLENIELDEIARWLAIPIGTVKSRLHRARTELRDRLAERTERSP